MVNIKETNIMKISTKQHQFSNKYKRKYKYLKKFAKSLIVENAALCDEVARTQESILIAKEERRYLLRKVLDYENEIIELPQIQMNRNAVMKPVTNGTSEKVKKRKSPDHTGSTPS